MTDGYEGSQHGEEMGASVQQPSYYVYQFHCTECSTTGAEFNTEGEAQTEGRTHQLSYHPPAATYTVQSIAKYS